MADVSIPDYCRTNHLLCEATTIAGLITFLFAQLQVEKKVVSDMKVYWSAKETFLQLSYLCCEEKYPWLDMTMGPLLNLFSRQLYRERYDMDRVERSR
jgi:hypothetical protein